MTDPKAIEAAREIVNEAKYAARPLSAFELRALQVARALLAGEGNNATAAAVPFDPWQPISTAPKDGTDVIVYEQHDFRRDMGYVRMAYWEGCWKEKTEGEKDVLIHNEVTCWMPRPAPPAGDAAGEKAALTQASESLARPSSSPAALLKRVMLEAVMKPALREAVENAVCDAEPIPSPSPAVRDGALNDLCSDCPPVGYPTEETRCRGCPRRRLSSPLSPPEGGKS